MKAFDTAGRRVAWSWTGLMPPFHPVASECADEDSQRAMYGLLRDAADALYADPTMLGLSDAPDECLGDWQMQNSRPELARLLSANRRKLDEFLTLLLRIGELGEPGGEGLSLPSERLKLSTVAAARLKLAGLAVERGAAGARVTCPAHPGVAPAWKLLSETALRNNPQPEASLTSVGGRYPLLAFSSAMFDRAHGYTHALALTISEDAEAIRTLEATFDELGYGRVDVRENALSLDYVKNYGGTDLPLKDSWAEREHGGLSIWIDWTREHPVQYGLRIPRYRELLMRFGDMDEPLRRFIARTGKKCDGCGYCTQTDKTGKRPRQLVAVAFEGKELPMCLMFPGFSFQWVTLAGGIAEDIERFVRFCDAVFA